MQCPHKISSKRYGRTLFLNFNYTKTIDLYINNDPNSKTINIHGSLGENNMIFGYGDESGESYSQIENLHDNLFFENAKSFGYLLNSNYSELISFINHDQFETLIWGILAE
ncbi:MAG: hypothetical protein IPJ31_14985 [Bacteroidetes bacterium]|nr:hypothetical protein [Bacteroidota bacterium]